MTDNEQIFKKESKYYEHLKETKGISKTSHF